MSTRASASTIVDVPVEKVWAELRRFDFPARLLGQVIKSVVLENGAADTQVGAVRVVEWKSGESKTQILLELSDIERKAAWETIASNPESEVSATITTISLKRVTDGNRTLLTWESEFSSDVKGDLIVFETKSYQQNLEDIKKSLSAL
eukprot:TRINITY_DN264_c0_g1_i1.p1 TRINITY_DN264_c0_g1~~TRINITY_DN264_c0_g1_i1.p1  ORF type:complete len:155 (-),score=49.19 TRINITY_DN264_c0_g1_i1:87-530(-)